uniref:Uncharacterized protein n=1 Tax=viral metagenome TaxID=1070528 RepID=A0A6C0JUE8_9ZZZZ
MNPTNTTLIVDVNSEYRLNPAIPIGAGNYHASSISPSDIIEGDRRKQVFRTDVDLDDLTSPGEGVKEKYIHMPQGRSYTSRVAVDSKLFTIFPVGLYYAVRLPDSDEDISLSSFIDGWRTAVDRIERLDLAELDSDGVDDVVTQLMKFSTFFFNDLKYLSVKDQSSWDVIRECSLLSLTELSINILESGNELEIGESIRIRKLYLYSFPEDVAEILQELHVNTIEVEIDIGLGVWDLYDICHNCDHLVVARNNYLVSELTGLPMNRRCHALDLQLPTDCKARFITYKVVTAAGARDEDCHCLGYTIEKVL